MKIVCIVAEYNPLHRGHVRHIDFSRPLGDATMVVMGGDFCQRGFSSVLDKYIRAEHAVRAGADIVVELPTLYTVNCAEQFAKGAMRLIDPLPDCAVSFGSECGDVDLLRRTAVLLEDAEVADRIHALVQEGIAYPIARQNALDEVARERKIEVADVSLPNNILGIEYVKAARDRQLYTLRRTQAYHSDAPAESSGYIRNAMASGTSYDDLVPDYVRQSLSSATDEAGVLYLAALRAHPKEYFEGLSDASEGLQNRIWQCAQDANTIDEAVEYATTKRYTRARIRRLFTAALLDLRQQQLTELSQRKPYYNVLAVRKDRTDLISYLAAYGDVCTAQRDLFADQLTAIDAKAHETYRLLHAYTPPQSIRLVDPMG